MRSHALLCAALLAAGSNASPHFHIRLNSSSSPTPATERPSLVGSILATAETSALLTLSSLPATASFSPISGPPTALTRAPSYVLSTTHLSHHNSSISGSSSSSRSLRSVNSSTATTRPASTPSPTACTGCVLEAFWPDTTWFDEEMASTWTSVVVTETILTEYITYLDGTAIDTIVTTSHIVNQTKTLATPANQTITHTTPVFTWEVQPDTTLTLDAGPTYVLYTVFSGGLDRNVAAPETSPTNVLPFQTKPADVTCEAELSYLPVWPTRTEEYYQYYIQTYLTDPPHHRGLSPVPLPSALIEYIKSDPVITSVFKGSDIATCTVRDPEAPARSSPLINPSSTSFHFGSLPVSRPTSPPLPPPETIGTPDVSSFPVFTSRPPATRTTDTYLSTTYESTSSHITRQGCLRCSTSTSDAGQETIKVDESPVSQSPDQPEQSITFGDSVLPVHPAQPTGSDQQKNSPNQHNPDIVIGTDTLAPGQTTTIGGVQVIVPPQGGGSSIIVGGSTIAINPAPTGPPVLTVGGSSYTANPQGEFVVGTQTLAPGGRAITVGGSTLSLGTGGTIAVVNGVTQTLEKTTFATGPLAITAGGRTVSATVIGGTTAFVFSPGQTLTPGGVIIVSGTTFSMPASASGSVVVVNGQTSTIGHGPVTAAAALTIDGKTYTATVRDGTTEYALGPGTTLKPGQAVTISGTVYSLDSQGTALIINGKTSSIPKTPASNLATATSQRGQGNFVASASGMSSKSKAGADIRGGNLDKTIEGIMIGVAGWLLMLL